MMNPYTANPDEIPSTDRYADVPFYGRYLPRPNDFRIDRQHANCHSPAALRYWASVLDHCNESVRIYPADEGGRDVFALGSIIVKSSHLHSPGDSQHAEVDYSYADANEMEAVALAESALKGIRVPEIYFAGKERLPGVSLTVAWPYLSQNQKKAFKHQARAILGQLHAVKPTDGRKTRSHVVPDPDILSNGRIHPLEGQILFSEANKNPDMGFMHNDLTETNCIVDNDKITGVVDWEMAGFFGWDTAGEVHRRIRTPQREHFVHAGLSEERLQEIMHWNDLYDEGKPEA